MIYPSELGVYLQSDVGQVLILLPILERHVELHMKGMDTEDNVANALKLINKSGLSNRNNQKDFTLMPG